MAVEDFSRVTDYLVTLPYVDADRIGALGICGGGGYAINATMIEHCIKALVSITGVNYGHRCREGFSGFDPLGQMEAMAKQRTAEAPGEALKVDLFAPPSMEVAVQAGMTESTYSVQSTTTATAASMTTQARVPCSRAALPPSSGMASIWPKRC